MDSANKKAPENYDPWYAKVAFAVFLSVLVGSFIAMYEVSQCRIT
jgi:hypothetical protein